MHNLGSAKEQADSQVDGSLQNQNLLTDFRWAAKQIRKSARKFTQVLKSRKCHGCEF